MLKKIVMQALAGNRWYIDQLCKEYHTIALAYLKTKIKKGNALYLFYKNLDDFAWDCIADLFSTSEGNILQVAEYFSDMDIGDARESRIFNLSRRLVFSKINEGIYRNYKDFDPSLSKIIRNLKRTLESNKVESASYDAGNSEIIFHYSGESRLLIPEELLQVKLGERISSISNSVEAVMQLGQIIKAEQDYANRYPIVAYAILLRKTFVWEFKAETEQDYFTNGNSEYWSEEIESFLMQVISEKKESIHDSYVKSGKISENTLNNYLELAEIIIGAEYIEGRVQKSHYEHFKQIYPSVSYEEYRDHKRTILEYIVKRIRNELIQKFKKEIKNSADRVIGKDIIIKEG